MKSHFLQSSPWEKYQQLEGKTTFRLNSDTFEALATLETTPLGNYLYCPYGPTLKSAPYDPNSPASPTSDQVISALSDLKSALSALKSLAKEHHAFFIRLEPTLPFPPEALESLHLKKSHDLDPAHTWVLDLTQSEEVIFKEMEKEKGRLWRNHAKKGLSIRSTKNPSEISILTHLLQNVGAKNHFNPQDESHLKHQLESGFATLYIVDYTSPDSDQPTPIAASLVYDYDGTRYYAHAASDDAHRKLVAGSILLVQMIVDAKNSSQTAFDFWGITTSEDPKHPWYGFTKYKKSFGGHQLDYSGTWDLPLRPARYTFYRIIRHLNRLKRKLLH